MKTNNHPTWLVPLETAIKLKEIGLNEPTLFHCYESDFDVSVETKDYYNEGEAQGYLNFYISALKEEDFNIYKKCVSIPTYEQVFEWFISKGFIGTVVCFRDASLNKPIYIFEIKDENGYLISSSKNITEKYEEAREALVNKLIEVYGNNKNN